MLHQSEGAKPKDGNSWACIGSPLSVEVHLDVFMEDTITTFDGLTVDTLSEVADLLWLHLDVVAGLARIRLIERKEALRGSLNF